MIVSTDSLEIKDIALKAGAEVPWLRSETNASDDASTMVVLQEVLNKLSEQGDEFLAACCLYPITPLVEVEDLKRGFEMLINEDFHVVFPVVRYTHPIWRSLKTESGLAKPVFPDHIKRRTQDLPVTFHDAGQWYWFKPNFLHLGLIDNHSGVIELSETKTQDVDNDSDWELLEMKYAWKQRFNDDG